MLDGFIAKYTDNAGLWFGVFVVSQIWTTPLLWLLDSHVWFYGLGTATPLVAFFVGCLGYPAMYPFLIFEGLGRAVDNQYKGASKIPLISVFSLALFLFRVYHRIPEQSEDISLDQDA